MLSPNKSQIPEIIEIELELPPKRMRSRNIQIELVKNEVTKKSQNDKQRLL
jgi:hypothetical protein